MATEVEIDLNDIKAGDEIRTERVGEYVRTTVQGIVTERDNDGDWLSHGELITYHDGYDETYFLIRGELPEDPGALVTFPSGFNGEENVFALKMYGEDNWLATFPDDSYAVFGSKTIASKDWTLVR